MLFPLPCSSWLRSRPFTFRISSSPHHQLHLSLDSIRLRPRFHAFVISATIPKFEYPPFSTCIPRFSLRTTCSFIYLQYTSFRVLHPRSLYLPSSFARLSRPSTQATHTPIPSRSPLFRGYRFSAMRQSNPQLIPSPFSDFNSHPAAVDRIFV